MDGTDSVIDMKFHDENHRASLTMINRPKVKSGSCPLSCKIGALCCCILIGLLLIILVPVSKEDYAIKKSFAPSDNDH